MNAAPVFYLETARGRLPVQARESWKPQRKRGSVTACRFMVKHAGRWRRVYADHSPGVTFPHFIRMGAGVRVAVSGVTP